MSKPSLLLALLFVACASKSDSAPPTDPEPAEAPADSPVDVAAETPGEEPVPEPKSEPKAEAKPEAAAKDVVAVLDGVANAKIFAELVAASPEFSKQLHSMDGAGFTLLVPTDEAFAKTSKATIEKWKKNQNELEKLIKTHIIPGSHDAGKLGNFRTAPTAMGKDIEVKVQESDVLVGGAKLVETDMKASNGWVHLIDKVLTIKK
jgi:uncharacterized surface protein with fasciclin (FAS1) repeats